MKLRASKILKQNMKVHGDKRGNLVSIEFGLDIPFLPKRIYYIYGTQKNLSRGHHAHKSLDQYFVCISGSCELSLDSGTHKKLFVLNKPNVGILVSGLIWREIHNLSEDCVLLVLASEHYDDADYIRNYDEFLSYTI